MSELAPLLQTRRSEVENSVKVERRGEDDDDDDETRDDLMSP
jgi:hypothetical protein